MQYVVCTKIGNVYGPFANEQLAIDWAKKDLPVARHHWWVSELTAVELH